MAGRSSAQFSGPWYPHWISDIPEQDAGHVAFLCDLNLPYLDGPIAFEALPAIPESWARAVCLRYGIDPVAERFGEIPMTFAAIAEDLGVSYGNVREKVRNGIGGIRFWLNLEDSDNQSESERFFYTKLRDGSLFHILRGRGISNLLDLRRFMDNLGDWRSLSKRHIRSMGMTVKRLEKLEKLTQKP